MSYKVVFCGTPDFAVPALKTLVESDLFEVALVLSQPDRPAGRGKKLKASAVKTFALEQGLEVITPEKCKAPEIVQQIKDLNADVGVVVAYGQIVPQEFLDSFKHGCVNIHGSLLPRWRGAAPIQRSIMAGDKETGVSLQVMVFELDAGDVIGERRIPLDDEMGSVQLYEKLAGLGSEMLTDDLVAFIKGEKTPVPQDESQVTYAKKILKEECLVNWNESAETIHCKIRGLNGGPFAYTTFRDKQLKLHLSSAHMELHESGEPGVIESIGSESFKVFCNPGTLELKTVQPESKSRMSAGDFIRGFQIKEGEKLG